MLTQPLAVRKRIGYCPQFDALFNSMSYREHLEFYAAIQVMKEDSMQETVEGMLNYLSLEKYGNRPAGKYRGGNKRKLSVVIAL